jgi:D-arabinan endo alpha-(1,5)-arabinofuranosidase
MRTARFCLRGGAIVVFCGPLLVNPVIGGTAAARRVPAAQTGHPSAALVVDKAGTYKVAQEIGPGSINATNTRWDVYGADLGSMFVYQGRTYMVFGDTFGGPAANPFFSVSHNNWRSNTMAYIGPGQTPSHGLRFSGMISGPAGAAKELLSSQKVVGVEQTVIPTYGVAAGNTMYLYYMSVKEFGAPGHWTCNYSGVAYSKDGGQTWTKNHEATWPGDSNFGQVALVDRAQFIYVFGIPCGRYGGLEVARVPQKDVLDTSAYRYWDGKGWTTSLSAAVRVVPAPVGELSVQWNSYYRKWLMMYLIDPTGQIVIRTADQLTGPWSGAQVVVTSRQYPELYAPFITPKWDAGPAIYFNMSMYGPYQVFLMRTSLSSSP